MSKHFFGFAAVAIAVGAVAYTKPFAIVAMKYDPLVSNDYSKASVETESNWKELATPRDCNNIDDRACVIFIDHSELSGTAPTRIMDAAKAQINANQGGDLNVFKVSSISNAISGRFINED